MCAEFLNMFEATNYNHYKMRNIRLRNTSRSLIGRI